MNFAGRKSAAVVLALLFAIAPSLVQGAESADAKKLLEAAQSKVRQTQGAIKEVKLINLEQTSEIHRAVVLQTKTGKKSLIVDLGPKAQTDPWELKAGDEIAVSGRYVNVRNKGLLIADRAQHEGDRKSLSRAKASDTSAKESKTKMSEEKETEQSSPQVAGLSVDSQIRVEPLWHWPGERCTGVPAVELISQIGPQLIRQAGYDLDNDYCQIEHEVSGTESLAIVSCGDENIQTFYTTEALCLFELHNSP